METWKKIQKKNKRNEILGIVCMGVCLTIGIICDWNVLVKNNVLIQIEDITSFSLTILQIQATIGTLIFTIIALITGSNSDSYMGVPISEFYLSIKPWKLTQMKLIVVSLGMCLAGVIFHSIGLYNMVFYLFIATLIAILISILEIYSAFKGGNKRNEEIEAYIRYVFESEMNYEKKVDTFQNYVLDWENIVDSQNRKRYDEFIEIYKKGMLVLWNYDTDDAVATIEQQSYSMAYCFLKSEKTISKEKGIEFEQHHKKGDILNLFFEEFVEEHLIQPTFIMDHPIEISPLTKKKPDTPGYVERFEFFMNGWEMANAYSELNDPIDQRERFKAQEELLALGDEEANTTDEDFLNALEIGMPPTGGIGFGIDRMCMLLTDSAAIRDVLLFPTMKSVGASKSANKPVAEPKEEKIDFSKVEVEPLFKDFVDFDTFSKSDFRAVKVKECTAVPKSKKLLQFTLDDGTGTDRTILSGIHSFYEPEELVGKTLIAITNLPPRAMMGIDSCGMLLSAIHEEEGEEKLHLLMVDDHIPAGAKLY